MSGQKKLQDLIDRGLIEEGEDFTERKAQELNIENRFDLNERFVRLLYLQRKARYDGTSPVEFLHEYIDHKFESYGRGNKGARGEAVEAVVRYLIRKKWINYSDVFCAEQKKTDIVSKHGMIEVGHNGKTFQNAFVPSDQDKEEFTVENYMNGKFSIVIYGAFEKDFGAELVHDLDRVGRIMKVFTDKYEFPYAIAGKKGLASGWNVAHEKATVQYNDALRIRFKEYCKVNHVPSLNDWINE